MVSSFQHMPLECTIRAGPTSELWGTGRWHSKARCVETACLQDSSGWDKSKGQLEGTMQNIEQKNRVQQEFNMKFSKENGFVAFELSSCRFAFTKV